MNIDQVEKKALKHAAERLTPKFHEMAFSAGWPADVVIQTSVEEADGQIYVDAPTDAIKAKVEDLQYGTPTSAPIPVILKFFSEFGDSINDIFEYAFEDFALELGAFN